MIQDKVNGYGKSFRLRERRDFQYLQSQSQNISSYLFKLYYKNSLLNSNKTRLGLSVSRKVGNSVFRNRIKRILRESFRKSEHRFLGVDMLVNIYPIKNKIDNFENILLRDFKKSLEMISKKKYA